MQFSRRENEVRVKPETLEDLWHLEKIIAPGDAVSGTTQRKFVSEGGAQERKKVHVTLSVEKAEFHKPSQRLKVLGKIEAARPDDIFPLHVHHSLDVAQGDQITIAKARWQAYELDRLKEAREAVKRPKIAALILDNEDAELFVIREYGLDSLGKIASGISGKYAMEKRKDLETKYFSEIIELLKTGETDKFIVAGPGFTRDDFRRFLGDKNPSLLKRMSFEAIGNTGRQGVYELVSKGLVDKILKESRFVEETKAIDSFIAEVSRQRPKAAYGGGDVAKAVDYRAVDVLLVLDSMLIQKKRELDPLLEQARKSGAKIIIVSSENDASAKLKAFGGIAATLRFAVE